MCIRDRDKVVESDVLVGHADTQGRLAAFRAERGLLHRGLHLSGRLAFRTSLVARVFYRLSLIHI